MKTDDKIKYVYNHVQTLKERLEAVKENLKWISDDIKIIEKLSNSENKAE